MEAVQEMSPWLQRERESERENEREKERGREKEREREHCVHDPCVRRRERLRFEYARWSKLEGVEVVYKQTWQL
jgi:hypothetical protein